MKKFLFVLLLFPLIAFAQTTEDQNPHHLTITEKAKFPGGDKAYREELFKMIHAYIDLQKYAVNGVFHFMFDIDVNGKIKNLQVYPKVQNSEMFIDDMLFAMKRVKTKWKPAMRDNKPVESKYVLKINFISDHFDHGD
ncbi:MAG: energy transducer TonB [Weeksellaceae bacterium]|nr:energy transducer TonB [Bacteroidota bacterium]MCG2780050.1 energy transducer TonB [Weeksellaceae bacterium]